MAKRTPLMMMRTRSLTGPRIFRFYKVPRPAKSSGNAYSPKIKT